MNPYLIAAVPLVAAFAGAAGYVYGRTDGAALTQAQIAHAAQVEQRAIDAAAKAAAQAIAGIRVQNKTIQAKVEREIQTHTVYVECRHAPGVLDSINDALTGRANGRPNAGVPSVDSAR